MAAGGFKMSLGGLKAKPGLKSIALKKDAKPKKALLGDDEPDDTNKQQEISGFDVAAGGAIDINGPKEKQGPLVIPSLPNRNWREEARKKQLEKAPHTQQQSVDVVMEEPEKEVVYGLTVPAKPEEAQENGVTEPAEPMEVDPQDNLTEAQRLEKQALESLLNGKSTDASRIVPAITDEEALQNDLNEAPDEPSLDAYEATPIEGFGLAMLRGMGWKDSDGESRKNGAKAPKEIKRRPALLGIGAKEDAAKDVELGEFNSKARGKKGKDKDAAQGYNPVTLRNKKTGEVITEEELKAKLEGQDLVQDEKPSKDSRGRDDDDEKSGRRRDRRDNRDRDRRRDDDYDSERRRERDRKDDRQRNKYDNNNNNNDSDRRREKRRDREDDYDSERRREKRRDRDRRDRSRSPRDDKRRDRYRSRSRDSKDKRARRDRSRSRDSDDRRRRKKERDYDDDRSEGRRRDRDDKSSRR
ncbi:DNA primase large subunit Spp2 [Ascochyta rabiei]|uniref:Pre-mRNA-splicing factor n=1 Tax=Didymella rabiei TaxID=5454 RepID=A0A163DEA7_DIDRA|nr:DNA primase large subunit Spp2 [Ascochyta rabiei]KZM23106.1 nucleic acid binding [Ascochyta rabiei]UPX18032.1 DNA primase large subunit Spp2 [Ascochyta rabiei]